MGQVAMSGDGGFSLDVHFDANTVTLVLRGDLDIASAAQLRDSVMRHAVDRRRIIIDLSELEFIDSTGVRILLESCRHARSAQSLVQITRPSRRVLATLELSGLLDALPFQAPVERR